MTAKSTSYRPDVQGVRALAVTLVVVYHVWPAALPGGYVGVDVFFVISGFLITGLLARGVRRDGRVRLLEFYGRRARRLMPAAALVLAVTWIASRVLLPVNQLPAAAEQIRASALYFQNVVLADDAVDYLKAEQSASPVQHFWSLSVEEQFYLVWPLVFVLAAGVAWLVRRRHGGSHGDVAADGVQVWHVVALGLGVAVVVASFLYSVHETATNPAAAYYVTTTRIWELGAGGLLALLPERAGRLLGRGGALGWLGLAAIVFAAVRYSGTTTFPGTAALLPVVGALALLACGSPRAAFGPAVLTATRPLIFLGGISYSLYLWHWPVVALYQAYRGHGIGVVGGAGVLALSVGLAWLTKRFVEDPVREARVVTKTSVRSLATVGLAAVPVLLTGIWLSGQSTRPATIDARHPGAAALVAGAAAPASSSLVPTLTRATEDLPAGITPSCEAAKTDTVVRSCVLGDTTDPTMTVALVGDSHAGQWSDALDEVAKAHHWRLVVATKSACPFTAVETTPVGDSTPYTSCTSWGDKLMTELLTTIKPDVVITSDRPTSSVLPDTKADAPSLTAIGQGMASYWTTLRARGIDVIGISETPQLTGDAPTCLATKGGTVATCSTPASKALTATSPVDVAAATSGSPAAVIDFTDLICPGTTCAPVVGNVIVYSDSNHLTRSYTLSLEPYLSQRLLATTAFAAST